MIDSARQRREADPRLKRDGTLIHDSTVSEPSQGLAVAWLLVVWGQPVRNERGKLVSNKPRTLTS